MLSEEELQGLYVLGLKADLAELVSLSGLFQQLVELRVKEANEVLALVIDKMDNKEVKA